MRLRQRIERWAEGKPRMLVLFALSVAAHRDDVEEWIKDITSGSVPALDCDLYRSKDWLRCYRSHRRIDRSVLIEFFGDAEIADAVQVVGDRFRAFCKMNGEQRLKAIEELNSSPTAERREIQLCGYEFGLAIDEIGRDYVLDLRNCDSVCEFDEAPLPIELAFYSRVTLPTLILFGEHVGAMYRRARSGDIDALCNLLSLDKSLVHDHRIAEIIRIEGQQPGNARMGSIVKALGGYPNRTTRSKQFAVAMAGMISAASRAFPRPLTAPQIRQLFDIVALAKRNELRDLELQIETDTFSRSIRRSRQDWHFFQPGQKSLLGVSG